MPKTVKVWNIAFDWVNAKNDDGEPLYKWPPTAKAGSLVFEYPPIGEYVDVIILPDEANFWDQAKREQVERGRRKQLERIISFSKTQKYPKGKLSLQEPGTEPVANATLVESLKESNAALEAQIAQLLAQLSANQSTVEAEEEPKKRQGRKKQEEQGVEPEQEGEE